MQDVVSSRCSEKGVECKDAMISCCIKLARTGAVVIRSSSSSAQLALAERLAICGAQHDHLCTQEVAPMVCGQQQLLSTSRQWTPALLGIRAGMVALLVEKGQEHFPTMGLRGCAEKLCPRWN